MSYSGGQAKAGVGNRSRSGLWGLVVDNLVALFSFDAFVLRKRMLQVDDTETRVAMAMTTAVSDLVRLAIVGACVFAFLI